MKILDILTETIDFDQLINLLDQAAGQDSERDVVQGRLAKMSQSDLINIIREFPMFEYSGPMVRLVSLRGLHDHVTIQDIREHEQGPGLKSFARTEHGIDKWTEFSDVEIAQTDVLMAQTGVGLSYEAIEKELKHRGVKVPFNITRAATVEEVLSTYNDSAKITSVTPIDPHEYDEDW